MARKNNGLGFPSYDHKKGSKKSRWRAAQATTAAVKAVAVGDCAVAIEALFDAYYQMGHATAHGISAGGVRESDYKKYDLDRVKEQVYRQCACNKKGG